MPDRTELKVGDTIKLIAVPAADLAQRKRELAQNLDDAGWTADTIEHILAQDSVVTITRIDEHGQPWFDYLLSGADGPEEHSLAVMDDESWVPVRDSGRSGKGSNGLAR